MSDSLVRVSRRVGPLRRTARSWRRDLRRGRAPRESSTQGPLGDCRSRRRWRACWRGLHRSCPPCWTSPAGRRQSGTLASNDFTYYFTFFSKFFSSFPHGTCSLSVSPKYLDLDGYYHPFVLQSQATRLIDSHPETDTNSLNGVVTLYDTKSKKDLNELMLMGNGNRPHVPLASQGIKGLI